MNEVTVSSPTESGCTGMSKPADRKGIVLLTSLILGLAKGTIVEILSEDEEYYKVKALSEPWIVRYVAKELIKEVGSDA